MKKPRAAITGCFDLPEDAVIEILARLPVNTLLRFKCVCKSWYALIKNLKFISKHLNYTSRNDDHARIVLKYCNSYNNRKAFLSFLSNKAVQITEYDTASTFLDNDDNNTIRYTNDLMFYGHCNGIICAILGNLHPVLNPVLGNLLYGNPITLWNPATREFKHLFVPNLHHRDDVSAIFLAVGFGFDTRRNDYKVIRIIDFTNRVNYRRIFDPVVEIYSLSTDSWRKLELKGELPKTIQFSRSDASTHLNGVYYWLANDAYTGKFVLSFDFANEVFEKLPLPEIYSSRVSTLVKFNETVCVIAYKGVFDCIVVWVLNMNDKVVGEKKKTWTKLYTIPSEWMRVIGFLKSGEAILIEGGQNLSNKFTLYDPSTQQYKYLRVVNGSVYESFQMVDYVESLVSFKGVIRFHTVF